MEAKPSVVVRSAFMGALENMLSSGPSVVGVMNIPREWLAKPLGQRDPAADAERRINATNLPISYSRFGWATYFLAMPRGNVEELGYALLGHSGDFPWRLALCDTGVHPYPPHELMRILETLANERATQFPETTLFVLGSDRQVARELTIGL